MSTEAERDAERECDWPDCVERRAIARKYSDPPKTVGPDDCVCGHKRWDHFPDYCNSSYFNAMVQARIGCECNGFQAKEAA